MCARREAAGLVENGDKRVTVDDLRKDLGNLAADPMIALQLQELEAVERVKGDFLPRVEGLVDRLDEVAEDAPDVRAAARMGLEVIADYVKYNQRWNDTVKTLMAIMKTKTKAIAASTEPASPFSIEQIELLGIRDGKQKAKGQDKKTKTK